MTAIRVTTNEYSFFDVLNDREALRMSFFHGGQEYFAIVPAEDGKALRAIRERFKEEVLPRAIQEGRAGNLSEEVMQCAC